MLNLLSTLRIQDLFDVIIVAVLIYFVLKYIRETRAYTLVKGVVVLVIVQQIAQFFGLYTLNYILKGCLQFGIIAVIIIFQPEIRRALERMGNTPWFKFLRFSDSASSATETITEICNAVSNLARHRTGSLIVLEQNTKLGDIISTGIELDSLITSELIINIFNNKAPLHDGAVVIRDDRIIAATCLLPLTLNQNLSKDLGTRHRAAIGVSETTDCVVIVTSEETGIISVARNGSLTRNLSVATLEKMLSSILNPDSKNIKKEAKNET